MTTNNQDNQQEDLLFEREKSMFQKQLNDALKVRENVPLVEDIIKLTLLKNAGRDDSMLKLVEVYNYFGLEQFVDLIDIMNGKSVQFPSIDEFKDVVKIAISYYFKYLKGKSWDEIKTLLNDNDFSPIKYGINCSKLNKFITELTEYQTFIEKHGKDEQEQQG